ncbi:TlpA family protein disulfide reductase [Pedosphaera parvula]|uniref:Alkyl hydroperoxide reductase/ Thiol specific antioxidant/ Mal allergen n=1 Tax=Pedosphaera parvula (strain Ellin514) TaxID=320771 RepID=B9XG80_PEDPL|nr:TlpA disulfide reductase family protein [Pedosphaera parvula]EEF61242.1 alkyl hydroperoxide reductase/ Thiol specific antioxidant/ Mal allergen [Pedosphaera parvula Ellin514]
MDIKLVAKPRVKASGWRIRWSALVLLLLVQVFPVLGADKLIGTVPPEWEATDWINSAPLKLGDLKGKVVLVRWWTAPTCPFCRATAPALNEFYEKYRETGLEVIGFYHHKSDEPLTQDWVKKYSGEYNFKFPVAIDRDWKTLHRWWLDAEKRDFTSVSFLIDRKGVIRYIHPGGEYVKGDKDYARLKAKIEELLKEH